MKRSDLSFIIKSFLGWRVLLCVFAFLSTFLIVNFGNRFAYADRVLTITHLPSWIWGFGNFDGVHYLKIAQSGYAADFSQAFFPLYPLLIRFFNFFPKDNLLDPVLFNDPSYFSTAMVLSIIFFIGALYFTYKLFSENYNKKIAQISILLLLSFPTAFYFGAVYSESLLLLLTVLTFWFTKKDKFLLAGLFAALASATKIQGAILFIFLAVELWKKYRNNLSEQRKHFTKDLLGILIAPLGLIFYMVYLKNTTGDFLYFLSSQPSFGAGRSSLPLIFLPQVIYRYLKIFLTVKVASLAFFNAFLEFSMTMGTVVVLIMAFKKMKFSYWIFSILVVILPTLTGTFSSMPRYVLMAFMLFPYLAVRYEKNIKLIIIAQAFLQIILLSMFIRGYWVS